ncbi:interferon alpha/beta receptor 2 isoform X2 [Ambystoma mexicanum]|uniref:interferon alpha/beta receptor 2 isoform X2 n=1 Tax=Ambystoma mexicanum TaxID=8296 RepID=UPI0037E8C999
MICFAAGMLTYLLWICPLITLAFTLLPAPRNITVRSQNFQHILTWRPGGPSSTPSFFRVQYRNLHGNRKVYVPRHCSNTSDLSCDLTNELTEDAVYYLQVQHLSAVGNGSEWGNMEFNPFRDTELGPPVVHITSWSGCINVTIQPPVSHLKSEDKTRFRSMMDVYTMLRYSITLEGPGFHEKIDKDAHEENYSTIIKDLLPKTNYCVSVVVTATSNLSKHPKPSALQCLVTLSSTNITTDMTYFAVIAGSFFSLGILFLLIGLHRAGFYCLRRPWPKVLTNFPKSENKNNNENHWKLLPEQVCSVEITCKEKKKVLDHSSEGEDDSDGEVICEDYTRQNAPDHSGNTHSQTFAGSSFVAVAASRETSGSEAAETEEPPSIADGSGTSKSLASLVDMDCTSAPLDDSGSFNVKLASVFIGALEEARKDDLVTQIMAEEDQDSSSSQNSSAPLLAFDANFLKDLMGVEMPELPDVLDDCFYNEALFTDESDDSDENQVSEYMRR